MAYKFIKRGHFPNYNKTMFNKGRIILAFAIFFFILGTDEMSDYLRFNHGMWHLCIGFSGYIY
jgi:predicted membrane channel-forming protein YqfA (hemolysin III family)